MTDAETLRAAALDLEDRGEIVISAALRKHADLADSNPTDVKVRINIRSAVSIARGVLRHAEKRAADHV